jgi:hypothetical protein
MRLKALAAPGFGRVPQAAFGFCLSLGLGNPNIIKRICIKIAQGLALTPCSMGCGQSAQQGKTAGGARAVRCHKGHKECPFRVS